MKKHGHVIEISILTLAVLSTGFWVYNMVVIPIYKERVFFQRNTLTGVEILILIGFALSLLFNIVSFLWLLTKILRPQKTSASDIARLALGALCLILLFGEKVMVDEIGREYRLGWETLGEWIILYGFFVTQLIYNLVILSHSFRVCQLPEQD